MAFLFAGYAFIWVVLFGYSLYIGNQQSRLSREIQVLKKDVEKGR